MSTARDDMPHVVYRCYARNGVLLYAGCTHNLNKRMTQHRMEQGVSGWPRMVTRITFEEWPDRASAIDREREVIQTEAPVFNVSGTGRRSVRVTGIETIERIPRPDQRVHLDAAAEIRALILADVPA